MEMHEEIEALTSLEKAKTYIASLSRSLQKRYEREKELEARIKRSARSHQKKVEKIQELEERIAKAEVAFLKIPAAPAAEKNVLFDLAISELRGEGV